MSSGTYKEDLDNCSMYVTIVDDDHGAPNAVIVNISEARNPVAVMTGQIVGKLITLYLQEEGGTNARNKLAKAQKEMMNMGGGRGGARQIQTRRGSTGDRCVSERKR